MNLPMMMNDNFYIFQLWLSEKSILIDEYEYLTLIIIHSHRYIVSVHYKPMLSNLISLLDRTAAELMCINRLYLLK